ncbi:hypothetical protein BSLG_005276 [Batrachochytrium salamandrivorans]|nr:hypothetical protein BSLG_005276 [Batrachochytrium salamandrivorans]
MVSPPKPWELGSSTASDSTSAIPGGNETGGIASAQRSSLNGALASSALGAPALPARPTSLDATTLNQGSMMQTTGALYGNGYPQYNRYGAGGYSGMGNSGYGGSYGSSYGNSYGGMGGIYGNGGYGSSYGNSYGGYSPYNRYGMNGTGYNRYGMGGAGGMMGQMGPNGMAGALEGEQPLTVRLEQSTQATFQLLDQIVQAFGGFAQMLDCVGSFRSISSTAPATAIAAADPTSITIEGFNAFEAQPTPQSRTGSAGNSTMNPATPLGASSNQPHSVQIRDLDFCRALYPFAGDSPGDLPLQPGDIIAVLTRVDPSTGQPTAWWRGRTQSGSVGIFPSTYVEILPRKDT